MGSYYCGSWSRSLDVDNRGGGTEIWLGGLVQEAVKQLIIWQSVYVRRSRIGCAKAPPPLPLPNSTTLVLIHGSWFHGKLNSWICGSWFWWETINTGPGTRRPGIQGPGTRAPGQQPSCVALSFHDRNAITCVNVLSSNVRLCHESINTLHTRLCYFALSASFLYSSFILQSQD